MQGWLHCVCESRLLLCTCDSGWLLCACDNGWMFCVCDGSWGCPWSISGWEGPLNYDWVWPLAVAFFCVLQFFSCFSPLLDLVSCGQWPDWGQASRPSSKAFHFLSELCSSLLFSMMTSGSFFMIGGATPNSFWSFLFNRLKFCFQKNAILNVYWGYI